MSNLSKTIDRRRISLAAALAVLVGLTIPAAALVGPTIDGAPFAPHVVMVLAQTSGGSAFCSGLVLTDRIVLTAAHCVAAPERTRVHFRDDAGQPVLLTVETVARHPQYHADAVRARRRSIDLALLRLQSPLPARFAATVLTDSGAVALGEHVRIAGFGVSREGAGSTGGYLREAVLAARAPLSGILLWAEDPVHTGAGACMGDSGAPIFSADGTAVVAIATWAAGTGKAACGALTQGVLLAPQKAWIDGVLALWNNR